MEETVTIPALLRKVSFNASGQNGTEPTPLIFLLPFHSQPGDSILHKLYSQGHNVFLVLRSFLVVVNSSGYIIITLTH